MVDAPGHLELPLRGLAIVVFSVDGERSRTSGTDRHGAHHQHFLL
jgi:hypothetical protein